MNHLLSYQWLSSALIQSIGWTLFHSLWLGALAVIATLIILWVTKKTSPAIRYNLLLTVFISFVISVIFAFRSEVSNQNNAQTNTSANDNSIVNNVNTHTFPVTEITRNYFTGFTDFYNNNAQLFVMIWFFIFCIQTVRLIAGFGYMFRIRQ